VGEGLPSESASWHLDTVENEEVRILKASIMAVEKAEWNPTWEPCRVRAGRGRGAEGIFPKMGLQGCGQSEDMWHFEDDFRWGLNGLRRNLTFLAILRRTSLGG
jgi:hypothetical protein